MKHKKVWSEVVLDAVFLVAELLSAFSFFFLSLPARRLLAIHFAAVLTDSLPRLLLQYPFVLDVRFGFSSPVVG